MQLHNDGEDMDIHSQVMAITQSTFEGDSFASAPPDQVWAITKRTIFGALQISWFPIEGWQGFASLCIGQYSVAIRYPDGNVEHIAWMGANDILSSRSVEHWKDDRRERLANTIRDLIHLEAELETAREMIHSRDTIHELIPMFDGLCMSAQALGYDPDTSAVWLIAMINCIGNDKHAERIHTHIEKFDVKELDADWASEKFSRPFPPSYNIQEE